jgi:hypothetical protein
MECVRANRANRFLAKKKPTDKGGMAVFRSVSPGSFSC